MSATTSLDDIRRAWESRDPELPRMIVALANASDPHSQTRKDGALDFNEYLRTTRSWRFRRKPIKDQVHYRIERMKELEAQDPDIPLPDRLKLWTIIQDLWQVNGPYERACLLEIIQQAPFRLGPWRALKAIFKDAEARGDTEIYGALAARLDQDYASFRDGEVTRATIAYLRRRAWRYLRRQAETLPATYADAAVDVLRFYTTNSDWKWRQHWVSNHIWFHDQKHYSRNQFRLPWNLPSPLKHRAYGELWRRTPRPLFTLLERARSEYVRKYAVDALKLDFRASLRDVEPAWVRRLINVRSATIDDFVVWLLKNVPRFEQGAFRELGLHQPVLELLSSQSQSARDYAASYARTHARDLPLEQLIRLIDNDQEAVRQLAIDLIQDRDPRQDIGLDAWGRLLETRYGHELAANALRKHFGARELLPAWFRDRLLSPNRKVFDFASKLLPKIHTYEALSPAFYQDLLEDPRLVERSLWHLIDFCFDGLSRFPVDNLDLDVLKRALINPRTSSKLRQWIQKGRLPARSFGLDLFKALASEDDWKLHPWVQELLASNHSWAENLSFDYGLCHFAIEVLEDPRAFQPQELGLNWLLQLVEKHQLPAADFADRYMVRHFTPADFADDANTLQGCEKLWDIATQEGEETPLSRFALRYMLAHHPMNAKDFQDQPEALIPEGFLTFERAKPLLTDARLRVRNFALELSRWDFRRWSPDTSDIVELCESPYSDLFTFVSQALLAEDKEEHARFRLDPDALTGDAVYRFCESLDKPTRDLGMTLIARNPKLAEPREMFRLTESPDRQVQAFVIRNVWSLYRSRGISRPWMPQPRRRASAKPSRKEPEHVGLVARPESWPATPDALRSFLRRVLFTVAPARLPASSKSKDDARLKPLPSRKAKLALIEVVRDLAIEDASFSEVITPLLEEFMGSRGMSEHDACLVALTRIRRAHGPLESALSEES